MVPGVRNAGDGEEGIRNYESQSDDELINQARDQMRSIYYPCIAAD